MPLCMAVSNIESNYEKLHWIWHAFNYLLTFFISCHTGLMLLSCWVTLSMACSVMQPTKWIHREGPSISCKTLLGHSHHGIYVCDLRTAANWLRVNCLSVKLVNGHQFDTCTCVSSIASQLTRLCMLRVSNKRWWDTLSLLV